MLIDVLISLLGMLREQQKAPAGLSSTCRGYMWCLRGALEHIELLSPANGRPPVVHPKFGVNVIGVCP